MTNKNIKRMFLFITLLILFVGVVSATESVTEESGNAAVADNIEKSTDTVATTHDTQTDSVTDKNKKIIKNNNNQTKKESDKIATKITLDTINTTSYRDNITVSGKYSDINGNNLRYTNILVNINNRQYITKTNKYGNYSYIYTTNTVGLNNITVSYPGNAKYDGASAQSTFTVIPKQTNLTINKIKNTQYTDNVTIKGKYTDINGNILKLTPLILNINGNQYETVTNNNGVYTYKYRTNTIGVNNVSVSYPGNTRYYGTTANATFNVTKQSTKVIINTIKACYDDNVTITGVYKDKKGVLLKKATMLITINNQTVKARTNSKGVYNVTYKADTPGKNNITVLYKGNTRYLGASNTTTFKVTAQPTILKINDIADTVKGENVTITGKYVAKNGKILKNTNITITVNNKNYTAKTNSKGVYTLKLKTSKLGVNNVTAIRKGNATYKGTRTYATFNVVKPKPVLKLDKISTIKYRQNVTITGTFKEKDGTPIKNAQITLSINGTNKTIKTNKSGMFKYTYKPKTAGNYIVNASYQGNEYPTLSTKKTLKVQHRQTVLTVNKIKNTQYSNNISITGHYSDEEGLNLRLTPLKISINGVDYSTTTDDDGNFKYNYKTDKIGLNKVTISYDGNNRYAGTKATKQFNVTAKKTVIKINKITNVTVGDTVQITGKYTDSSGNPLKYTTLTLNINGNDYHARTNDQGIYNYTYRTQVTGTNTINASYYGTEKYAGTSTKITFYVNTTPSNHIFKTRKTKVASVFVSGTVNQTHVNKWVNSGITDVYVRVIEATNNTSTLRKTIDLCKNTNIKVHAWVIVFRDDNQKWDYSLNTRNKMKRFMNYVMRINGVEGICLDYIRYSGLDPSIVNTNMVTNYVKEISSMVKAYDSRMEVSACIIPEIKSLTYYYGQDVKAIEKNVDFMILMAYKNNYYKDTDWMVKVTKELINKCSHAKVVTSLTTYSDLWGRQYLSLNEITNDIKAVMNAGSYGYSLFSKSTTPRYPKIF